MECNGFIRVWLDEKGKPVRFRLMCEGECPNGKPCEIRRSENQHGGVREWCGCSKREPTGCHTVLVTIGPGEDPRRAGQKEVICAGGCEGDDAQCCLVIIREREIAVSKTGDCKIVEGEPVSRRKIIDVRCQCV